MAEWNQVLCEALIQTEPTSSEAIGSLLPRVMGETASQAFERRAVQQDQVTLFRKRSIIVRGSSDPVEYYRQLLLRQREVVEAEAQGKPPPNPVLEVHLAKRNEYRRLLNLD